MWSKHGIDRFAYYTQMTKEILKAFFRPNTQYFEKKLFLEVPIHIIDGPEHSSAVFIWLHLYMYLFQNFPRSKYARIIVFLLPHRT